MKGFYRWRWAGKEVSNKEWIVLGKVTFLWAWKGSMADYLASAAPVIPD